MKKKFIAGFTAVALFLTMVVALAATQNNVIDWDKGVVRATGLGAANRNTTHPGLKRSQARHAARMDAERNLAEAVRGVQVTSESSMRDLELEYDVVKTRVNAIIAGMSEVSVKDFEDGTAEMVLEMPLFGSDKTVAEAAFLPYKDEKKVPFPQPTNTRIRVTTTTAIGGVSTNNYTGLVIDCTGMNLQPVMSPVIRNDNGQSIYGHENLDYRKIIEMGMAAYAEVGDDDIIIERAGDNPLIVKAVDIGVASFHADPVISVNDADKVLIANQSDQFLDNCAVVFVK